MVQQVMAPSSRGFLYGLLNSSFAFYLFSFQGKYNVLFFVFDFISCSSCLNYHWHLKSAVHEKSILLPLLPASLLALEERRPFKWLMFYGLFSMFPLLCRDKLVLPYFALHALFMLLYLAPCGHGARPRNARPNNTKFDYFDSFKTFMNGFIYLSSFILHIVYLTMHPPEKFPYLFEAIIMLICFYQFALLAFYTNVKQWSLLEHSTTEEEKKLIWLLSFWNQADAFIFLLRFCCFNETEICGNVRYGGRQVIWWMIHSGNTLDIFPNFVVMCHISFQISYCKIDFSSFNFQSSRFYLVFFYKLVCLFFF